MYISVQYMCFKGCVRECKWADDFLASCEMLRNVVQCQPSLAAPNYEGGSVFCFYLIFFKSLYLTVFAAFDNRLCDM